MQIKLTINRSKNFILKIFITQNGINDNSQIHTQHSPQTIRENVVYFLIINLITTQIKKKYFFIIYTIKLNIL